MSTVGWELGLEGDFGLDAVEGDDFGAIPAYGHFLDVQNLEAMNTYVIDQTRKVDAMLIAGKLSKSNYDKFFKLVDDWKSFYYTLTRSWYISSEDVNVAKGKIKAINMVIQPEATKQAAKYSSTASGQVDTKKYEAETQSFLQRHWLPILGITIAGGAAVYISGAALAYLKLAQKSGIIRALGR